MIILSYQILYDLRAGALHPLHPLHVLICIKTHRDRRNAMFPIASFRKFPLVYFLSHMYHLSTRYQTIFGRGRCTPRTPRICSYASKHVRVVVARCSRMQVFANCRLHIFCNIRLSSRFRIIHCTICGEGRYTLPHLPACANIHTSGSS